MSKHWEFLLLIFFKHKDSKAQGITKDLCSMVLPLLIITVRKIYTFSGIILLYERQLFSLHQLASTAGRLRTFPPKGDTGRKEAPYAGTVIDASEHYDRGGALILLLGILPWHGVSL